jgi:5-methylcytosine-specific restriction protein A
MAEFGTWAPERTRLDDFVVGQRYSGSHLVIFAELYDNRSGGILRIGKNGKLQAVFVKATFSGGKYANQWLSEPERLKYYLKSRNDVFGETFVENAAIIENPAVPVFVFHRDSSADRFTFAGAFKNEEIHREEDGSKWFELAAISPQGTQTAVDEATYHNEFNRQISKAGGSSRDLRLARLKVAPRRPAKIMTVGSVYVRNPDVVVEVLYRAGGACEGCKQSAPFSRNKDGSPYLEVHHRVHLSEGGDDTVENALALCPNCHRQEHHGPRVWQ